MGESMGIPWRCWCGSQWSLCVEVNARSSLSQHPCLHPCMNHDIQRRSKRRQCLFQVGQAYACLPVVLIDILPPLPGSSARSCLGTESRMSDSQETSNKWRFILWHLLHFSHTPSFPTRDSALSFIQDVQINHRSRYEPHCPPMHSSSANANDRCTNALRLERPAGSEQPVH